MKKCARYKILLSRCMDNDLDESEQTSLEKHLESCPECRCVRYGYQTIKRLVRENGALPADDIRYVRKPDSYIVKKFPNPTRYAGMRIAASIAAAVSIAAIFLLNPLARRVEQMPVVIESESRSVMNSPLGALVYYEELAGRAIHAQYTHIKDNSRPSAGATVAELGGIKGYQSPLFCDTAISEQRYQTVAALSTY
jgi:predicted anti-sigma-YlaC factor YlaD